MKFNEILRPGDYVYFSYPSPTIAVLISLVILGIGMLIWVILSGSIQAAPFHSRLPNSHLLSEKQGARWNPDLNYDFPLFSS